MSSISPTQSLNKIRGYSLLEQAELWAASRRLDRARRLFAEAVDWDPTGVARLRFGEFLYQQGQDNEAATEFTAALEMGRRQQNAWLTAAASQFLAVIFREQGETALAESYQQQAIAAGLREQGSPTADCSPPLEFSTLANAAISRGDLDEAARIAELGLNYANSQNDAGDFGDAWGTWAVVRLLQEDHKAAWRGFLTSYAAHCRAKDDQGRIADLWNLAQTAHGQGWWTVARQLLRKADKLARQSGTNRLLPQVERFLDIADHVLTVADRVPEWN